ncbi:MAG: peptidoglycan binding domain-containing protein, partial [Anaerolineales bacterium]|nr:peptidoglycan binding domain-containing protein [Anaerolineales bacterium]
MINNPSPSLHLARLAVILLVGTSLFVLGLSALAFGYRASYQERIYPGVRVAWVDLSGLGITEATGRLTSELAYPQTGKLLLSDGERSWLASPSQVGLILGADHNARRAYQIGRQGNLAGSLGTIFDAWYAGIQLTPEMFFDEQTARRYLATLAEEIDTPTVEASLSIAGTDVVVKPGQIGRSLDIAANTALLQSQVQSLLDGEIQLVVNEDPPAILDVSVQAEIARTILSAPLTLNLPGAGPDGPGPWTIPPENLANMLVIERLQTEQGDTYQVGLSSELLREYLSQLAPGLYRERANARFIFNDDTRQLEVIQPSVTGQHLDVESSIQLINETVVAGEHQVNLDMEYTLPEVGDDATAESLGITELVHNEVSYFRGSSPERVQNIATAAARFHGVLVAPGETFSMAAVLGDVSLDTGYAEAWIIYGDRTIKG